MGILIACEILIIVMIDLMNVEKIVNKNVLIIVGFGNVKIIAIIKFDAVKTAKSKKDGLQILMGVLKET